MSLSRLSFLAVLSLALGASAEVRWTYENGVLTEIASATSGTTLWSFKLSAAGELTKNITGNGSQLDFRKAAMPEGAPAVKTVDAAAFHSGTTANATLKQLYLGEETTTLGNTALMNFTALTNCTFGAAFTTMGGRCFKSCSALQEVVLPPLVKSIAGGGNIGGQMFQSCTSLKRVVLPENLETLEGSAFNGCSSLTNVTPFLPKSVKSLGNSAFYGCGDLRGDFEYGFATDGDGNPIPVSLASGNNVLANSRHITSIRLGPGFSDYPLQLTLYNEDLAYLEMGENISVCHENFNPKSKNPPLTNVVIKYTGTIEFDSAVATFNNLKTIREMSFGGWFAYTANATYNPFKGWTDLQARFFVSGTNDEANAFCSDVTKVTPWVFVPQADRDVYYARYGADAPEPHGVTVAVPNGLPRTFIVRNGGEPLEMRNMPYEDELLAANSAALYCLTNGDRHVYVFTNANDATGIQLKKRITLKEALAVGGGGGGGSLTGGGGGGGGVLYLNQDKLFEPLSIFKVTVGAGGAGGTGGGSGTSGGLSSFDDGVPADLLRAFGGGGGGGYFGTYAVSGPELGSGGGSSSKVAAFKKSGTDYTEGQGNPGGSSSSTIGGGGGGGGWLKPGDDVKTGGYAGAGGEGMTNSITGVAAVYGSGGGGGTGNPNTGSVLIAAKGGTNAGDGAEYAAGSAGKSAPNGFGGGGGGGGYYNKTATAGGRGGNGVVILSVVEGGTAGQPVVGKDDISITFPDGCTQPHVSVRMGGEPGAVYSAIVRISCGTGALAQAGTAFDCVRDFASVTNGQVLAFLSDFYPVTGEEVYVKVEVMAVGAVDVTQTNQEPSQGEMPPFVGHGGGPHVIHVRLGAKGKADGTSWADAYTDFREAIKELDANRTELWFCGSNTANSFTTTITPSAAAVIRGGFAGMEDSLADRPEGSRSVVSGDSGYDCFTINNDKPLTLEGFFVTKGRFHGLVKSGTGDITVTNCVFDGNGTYAGNNPPAGRALSIAGVASSTTATVADCTILRHYERDVAGAAGALSLSSLRQAWVTDCLFASNGVEGITGAPFGDKNGRSGHWGSALAAANAPVTVERCEFRGNVGHSMYINGSYGGGIVMLRGNCDGSVFRNCAWIGNNSLYSKGATTTYTDPEGGSLVVRLADADQVARVENCTFVWNFYSGSNSTAGVNVRAGTVAITNTIVWGNACGTRKCVRPADLYVQDGAKALVGYSRFSAPSECAADEGGLLDLGAGCTFGDPLLVTSTNDLASCRSFGASIAFKDAAGAAISSFDAHERKHSPAIDTGDPKSPYRNEPKPCGWRVNLGAYGNTDEAMTSPPGTVLFVR